MASVEAVKLSTPDFNFTDSFYRFVDMAGALLQAGDAYFREHLTKPFLGSMSVYQKYFGIVNLYIIYELVRMIWML